MRVKYLLLGIMALGLLSCDKNDDIVWDINPVVVTLNVVDAKGVDILNPENSNSIPLSGVKAFYNGVEYECSTELMAVSTKAYLPHFYGLRAMKNTYNGSYYLQFGELEGAKSYLNEEVTISWGDGTSDKIKFNRKFRWKSNGDPEAHQEWFLNGTKVPNSSIRIVKLRNPDK